MCVMRQLEGQLEGVGNAPRIAELQARRREGAPISRAQRRRDHPLTTGRMVILLKRQRGACAGCGLLFTDRESIEVDHVVPRSLGGDTTWLTCKPYAPLPRP